VEITEQPRGLKHPLTDPILLSPFTVRRVRRISVAVQSDVSGSCAQSWDRRHSTSVFFGWDRTAEWKTFTSILSL